MVAGKESERERKTDRERVNVQVGAIARTRCGILGEHILDVNATLGMSRSIGLSPNESPYLKSQLKREHRFFLL